MKNITYNNINSNFCFENVCLELNKFWIKQNLLNKNKIWLTITIYNKQNKSFTLINNLPFNIGDYPDIIIVLKQIFDTKSFSNRKDKINNIVFKYYLEGKFNWKEYAINLLLFILYSIFLVYATFIIFYVTSEIFNILLCTETINNNNLEVISQSTMPPYIKENTCDKYNNNSILSNFFDKSSFSYIYYPNQYNPNNFFEINTNITYEDNNITTLNSILSKQFYVLDKTVQEFREYFNKNELLKHDLKSIATEYSNYKAYCLNKNNIVTTFK